MNPEERKMLERTLELTKENHEMLIKVQNRAHRAAIWGFIKLLIVVVPLVIGYLYLEPHIDGFVNTFNQVRSILPR